MGTDGDCRIPNTDLSLTYMVLQTLYTLILVVSSALFILRRHRHPIRLLDPYLLVTTVFIQFCGGVAFAPFISASITNCFLQELIQVPAVASMVLSMARFWRLLIASHRACLYNDTKPWLLRHSCLISPLSMWLACVALIAVLVLCQLAVVKSDPLCIWGLSNYYFNCTVLMAYWLSIAFVTWKLHRVQNGFFIVRELLMLGVLILVTNGLVIFWMGFRVYDNTIAVLLTISAILSIMIQMWYPLWTTYHMSGHQYVLPNQTSVVVVPVSESRRYPTMTGSNTITLLTAESTLLDILQHPAGFEAMKKFSTLDYSVDNLLCWEQLHAQKHERNPETVEAHFRDIFEGFVANGSQNELNIHTNIRMSFEDVLKDRTGGSLLLGCSKSRQGIGILLSKTDIQLRLLRELYYEILSLIELDSFHRFKQTVQYRELLHSSGKGRPHRSILR